MDPRRRVFLTIFVLMVLIAGLYLFSDWFSKATGYVLGEDQKVKFMQCLMDENSALYITHDCIECEKQRETLGEKSYGMIDKITCGEDLCGGLRSVPAWEIEGKFYYGMKDFKQLDEISSCNIQ